MHPEWEKTLFDHIEISKNLHHIKKVVLFDNLDCGAYKTFRPKFTTEEEERELHQFPIFIIYIFKIFFRKQSQSPIPNPQIMF